MKRLIEQIIEDILVLTIKNGEDDMWFIWKLIESVERSITLPLIIEEFRR